MKNEEKIKVFISSKCGGERLNFDKLVEEELNDKKAIANKATKTSYDLVRRGVSRRLCKWHLNFDTSFKADGELV